MIKKFFSIFGIKEKDEKKTKGVAAENKDIITIDNKKYLCRGFKNSFKFEVNDDGEIIINLNKENISVKVITKDGHTVSMYGWSHTWVNLKTGDKVRFFTEDNKNGSPYIIIANKNPGNPGDMYIYDLQFNPKQ